jgi:ATP-dependent helicase/nuclease subunit B
VCPYRFYLRSVVRIAGPDREASVAALDARERGVLFHQLLHETLTQLSVSDAPRALDVQAAEAVLDNVLSQLRAERSARDPQRARLIELELRSLRADLEGFLHEQARNGGEWLPRASELRFGEAPDAAAITVAGLPLSGAIDLVEQGAAPGSPETPQLRATDFKTGGMHDALERKRHGPRSITAGGLVLQPLLYALALEQIFPEAQVRAGRLYYCTRKEQYESYVVELNERTREIATRLAQYANDMLSQGFLPAAPDPPEVCTRCEYQVICGPHEAERVQKIKRRDTGRLRSLDLLRGLP